jgi:hypothetical protein
LKLFGDGEEGVEVVLSDVDLTVVHEVEDAEEVVVGDTPQVDERVRVSVCSRLLPKHLFEEVGAGAQDDLVGLEGSGSRV